MFSAIAKKDLRAERASLVFSGFRVCREQFHSPALPRPPPFVRSDFRHVGGDVQRSSTSSAPIAIDTQSTEKSIWPIGGMTRRTGFKIGSQSCASKRTPGA
jgi:hypothetical protein